MTKEINQFDALEIFPSINAPISKLTKESTKLLVPSAATYKNVVGINSKGVAYDDRLHGGQNELPKQLGSCSLCQPYECLALAAAAKLYKLSGRPSAPAPNVSLDCSQVG